MRRSVTSDILNTKIAAMGIMRRQEICPICDWYDLGGLWPFTKFGAWCNALGPGSMCGIKDSDVVNPQNPQTPMFCGCKATLSLIQARLNE